MTRKTLTDNYISTICWLDDSIVDWANAGIQYFQGGSKKQLGRYHYGSDFNQAIVSENGQYAFICYKLGTKGLLLKNGEIMREINRSYNCSSAYEYPATFVTINKTTYLIHCPIDYYRLDFEEVETGEIVTDIPGREPFDTFHSRLEISPSNTFLMSKGWEWHPVDVIQVFNIEDCLKNPLLLDNPAKQPDFGVEICTANFITDTKVLIGSTDEVFDEDIKNQPTKSIGVWDITTNQISNCVKVVGEFGNLFAINEHYAWDTFKYPKIINIKTGEIADAKKSIKSGSQNSSITNSNNAFQIAFNNQTKQLAIKIKNKIEILTPSATFTSP